MFEKNCEFSGLQLGQEQPVRHQTLAKPLPFSITRCLGIPTGLQTLTTGPHVKGPNGTGISQLWVSTATCWAGLLGGVHQLYVGQEAPPGACPTPVGVGPGPWPTRGPEDPEALAGWSLPPLELPVGGGTANQNLPARFLFGNLETAPFMTFSRGGGGGVGGV